MRNTVLFLFSAIGASLALASPAAAKYSLCNKTSYALSAAIGYVDGERLATRGWWRLRPGQCKVVLTEATDPGRYFVYAESLPGHKGPLRAWSGDTPLCVENEGFFNLRNQEVCREDPTHQRSFFDVEVTAAAKGSWQTDFAEAANFTVYSAEVAGVQRLLNDLDLAKIRIDGSLGRNTQRAIAAYRKEKKLGDGAVIDDATIDAMIDEADAREAKLGLFFCNKTDDVVWSALAEPVGDKRYQSRGWWRLNPGQCTKIVKGALGADHYYVYGVVENPKGEMRLAGGERKFCINEVRFNAMSDSSCADQELTEAIFKRVDIGGAKSETFDFVPKNFVAAPSKPEENAADGKSSNSKAQDEAASSNDG